MASNSLLLTCASRPDGDDEVPSPRRRATGGDLRRLCDLFGLSISGAERYRSALNHPDLDPADHTTSQPPSNLIDTIPSSLID